MTTSATPRKSTPASGDREVAGTFHRRPHGRRSPVLCFCLLTALVVILPAGCRKPPPVRQDDRDTSVKGDPWETAGKRLRKEPDFPGCRSVLTALNADLGASETAAKPAGLTSEAETALAALVPLSAEDREEIRGAVYSAHDPAYLAESLYLRDAARAFDLPARPGQTPEQLAAERADLAFAWVCRQVYLNPWVVAGPAEPVALALPPASVLRRGYGSALERMYVFLAVLRQMGLDGCLVGPPGARETTAYGAVGPDRKTPLPGGPARPFWAVGVRVGGDVRLYDPWSGGAFPAALGALKANPDAHKAWFADAANVSGVTPEDAKAAAVYLAVPVNSLAPRMATLEGNLNDRQKGDHGVRLAVDPVALRAAFPDPKPAFWNPPGDPFAYGRTARSFLPTEEGGHDRTPPTQRRLFTLYFFQQLPASVVRQPPEVPIAEVYARLVEEAAGSIKSAFMDPPNIRERIQRGQFQDAAREAVEKQDTFARGLERLRNSRDAEQQLRAWGEAAAPLYRELDRAKAGLAGDKTQAVAAAQTAVDQHWRAGGAVVRLLVDRAVAEVGQAEATFLLAVCKHEQAERAQTRADRAAAPDAGRLKAEAAAAWAEAVGEWRTYEGFAAAQAGFPGRAAHVRSLIARAEELARKK